MSLKSTRFKFFAILLFSILLCCGIFLNYNNERIDILSNNSSERFIDIHSAATSSNDRDIIHTNLTKDVNLDKVDKVKVSVVNCRALFVGDPWENKKADRYHKKLENVVHKSHVPTDLKECDSYLASRGYTLEPVNGEEKIYPIAFSILVYKDFHQFEKLLRAIYRPQNYYCIHVDKKSDEKFKKNVQSLVDCINSEKFFISPVSFDVQWATITVLQPEIECMKQLWNRFLPGDDDASKKAKKKKPLWKYFINLTGQEFPLRTNLEIVRILKILNGSNNVEATRARMAREILRSFDSNPAPGGLKIWKGSIHVILSREFVDFALHHPISGKLLDYLHDTWVPDEHFFSTLNNNPNLTVPGAYTGPNPETNSQSNRFIARFKNWGYPPFAWPCRGKWVRQICNFGIGDLPLLASRDELFANKFDYNFQPLTYDCMEELLYNRTELEKQEEATESEKRKRKKLVLSEIDEVMKENLRKHPKLRNGPEVRNMDHLVFPDVEFSHYGDEGDGQHEAGSTAGEDTLRYLESVRPTIHEPGEVDFDHYSRLDFVRNHLHVPDDWTFGETISSTLSATGVDPKDPKNSTSSA